MSFWDAGFSRPYRRLLENAEASGSRELLCFKVISKFLSSKFSKTSQNFDAYRPNKVLKFRPKILPKMPLKIENMEI